MPALEVKIGDKTYHVEVPAPGALPLEVIVDGLPFEVRAAAETAKPENVSETVDHTAVLTAMTRAYRAKLSCYSRNGD